MKSEKLKTEIKDIYDELAHIRVMMETLIRDVESIKETVMNLDSPDYYEHPWYKYKREELSLSGQYVGQNR